MKPFYWTVFYAVFGGLASAAGIMTLLYSPGYWIFGLFGTTMGFYGFFQAWILSGKPDKRKPKKK